MKLKYIISLILLTASMCLGQNRPIVLNDGRWLKMYEPGVDYSDIGEPVARWKISDTDSTTNFADSIGGKTAILVGNATNKLSGDGVYLFMSGAHSLNVSAFSSTQREYSISMWIQSTQVIAAANSQLFDSQTGRFQIAALTVGLATTNMGVYNSAAWVDSQCKWTNINNNVWHNLIWTFRKNENINLYVDGLLFSVMTNGWTTTATISGASAFASRYDSSSLYYKGMLDDIMIYNTVLTTQQAYNVYFNDRQ